MPSQVEQNFTAEDLTPLPQEMMTQEHAISLSDRPGT